MSSKLDRNDFIFSLLLFALISVCLGRGYQCIFWDIPIRSLFWNEDLMTPFVRSILGLTWDQYIIHPQANGIIQGIVSSCGVFMLLFLFLVLVNLQEGLTRISLYLISAILIFIAILYHLEKFRTAGQFFEYSLQFMTPFLLVLYIKSGLTGTWVNLLKFTVAFTFISHGLYALGFYPVPGNFVTMTINIFNCSDGTATSFLRVMGVLDIVFSIGLFFGGRIFKLSAIYCIVWGFITAVARVVAYIDFADFSSTLHQWGFETLYRFPHFIWPFILYKVVTNLKKEPY